MTAQAWRIIAAVEAMRDQLAHMDLDEASTFERVAVRARVEVYDNLILLLRAELPDVEVAAVMAAGHTRTDAQTLLAYGEGLPLSEAA